ncbi:hypothetical protein [Kribbella sp. NPDC004875]|uniref:hypothetical protein n=1 Tax=Kribbella sp. NPDC004875 TaxID=3364107 RepID=UPI0036C42579
MPCAPNGPPDPTALHQAFNTIHPLDWDIGSLSASGLTDRHGAQAAARSLELLQDAVAVEPQVTVDFLAAIPTGCSPYQLDRRVKSPDSLARKLRSWMGSDNRRPVDDLLRYTVLTESPDELVAAAHSTAEALTGHRWQVVYAMHSYTDGSRYKGIHAHLRTPHIGRVEVQWHSVDSARVKELTTRSYEIERDATVPDDERAAARESCVEASAQLRAPGGIDGFAELCGRRVVVKNYSDSQQRPSGQRPDAAGQGRRLTTARDRGKGVAR